MSTAQVVNSAEAAKINVILDGSGTVVTQDVASGTSLEVGSVVTVTLQTESVTGY